MEVHPPGQVRPRTPFEPHPHPIYVPTTPRFLSCVSGDESVVGPSPVRSLSDLVRGGWDRVLRGSTGLLRRYLSSPEHPTTTYTRDTLCLPPCLLKSVDSKSTTETPLRTSPIPTSVPRTTSGSVGRTVGLTTGVVPLTLSLLPGGRLKFSGTTGPRRNHVHTSEPCLCGGTSESTVGSTHPVPKDTEVPSPCRVTLQGCSGWKLNVSGVRKGPSPVSLLPTRRGSGTSTSL